MVIEELAYDYLIGRAFDNPRRRLYMIAETARLTLKERKKSCPMASMPS